MKQSAPKTAQKRRGRPVTREIKLDATPEQVARAMFIAPAERVPSGVRGGR